MSIIWWWTAENREAWGYINDRGPDPGKSNDEIYSLEKRRIWICGEAGGFMNINDGAGGDHLKRICIRMIEGGVKDVCGDRG